MRIELTSGHTVLADDADLELLLPYSWHLHRTAGSSLLYAAARIRGDGPPYKRIKMHRLIMNPPAGMVVHHKNNDGLDNRRSNLEITTNRQNILYAYEHKEGGVHFHKQTGRWRAQLRDPNGKMVSLGMHATRGDALAAANKFKDETRT